MRSNRHWLRWVGYIAGGLLTLLFLLACVGFIYEQIEESRDQHLNHPPGLLVDMGGYRMHLYCIGQGSPTVVLDSGLGDYWLSWYKVQPQSSRYTHVCSYDRAGLGWSDPSLQPRTSKVFAQELHALLHQASIPEPYVLVGHSLGGINVRMFASLYPSEVVGMILVDSAYPHQEQRFSARVNKFNAGFYRELDLHALTMPIGIPRLVGWCGTDPPEFRSVVRAVECRKRYFRSIHDEWVNFDEDGSQLRAVVSLGNMPLVVLSHDPEKLMPGIPSDVVREVNEVWEPMQEELAHLSSNSSRVIAKGSTHYIQIDRPDVVIEAIRDVVDQCRVTQAGSPP
jgi:pimeloyl-ACP methyl ester carboxylesterase